MAPGTLGLATSFQKPGVPGAAAGELLTVHRTHSDTCGAPGSTPCVRVIAVSHTEGTFLMGTTTQDVTQIWIIFS